MRFSFQEYLKEKKKHPEFRKGFEEEKLKLQIGYQVFLARKTAGLTQKELAHRIGTSQTNISRLEQGDYNFTIEMLEKISTALNAHLKIEMLPSRQTKKAA